MILENDFHFPKAFITLSRVAFPDLSPFLRVEAAKDILEIQNIKKLKGHRFFYRIRIGQYRVGLKIEKGTVSFAAFDHRKDIYKYFP